MNNVEAVFLKSVGHETMGEKNAIIIIVICICKKYAIS